MHSRDEFWHRKYTEDEAGRPVPIPAGGATESELSDAEINARHEGGGHSIHMPAPSYWPFVLALALPILGYGAVFKTFWFVVPGMMLLLFGFMAWAIEPADAE